MQDSFPFESPDVSPELLLLILLNNSSYPTNVQYTIRNTIIALVNLFIIFSFVWQFLFSQILSTLFTSIDLRLINESLLTQTLLDTTLPPNQKASDNLTLKVFIVLAINFCLSLIRHIKRWDLLQYFMTLLKNYKPS